jgi:hypothetical protein
MNEGKKGRKSVKGGELERMMLSKESKQNVWGVTMMCDKLGLASNLGYLLVFVHKKRIS